jgi:hypothetical protein
VVHPTPEAVSSLLSDFPRSAHFLDVGGNPIASSPSGSNAMLVRDDHEEVYDLAIKKASPLLNCGGVAITGQPGIGSFFFFFASTIST